MNNASASPHLASQEAPAKLTDWVNEPTIQDLKTNLTDAENETNNQVVKINEWLDHLNITGSAKLQNKDKRRSTIQPKLIRKQAEWRYSSLSEPFLSTPDLFNVSPVTFEDKKAAEQNELLLNYQFNHHFNKVDFIDEYVRAGVDEGTIIARVGWEYEDEEIQVDQPIYESRQNPSPEFAAHLTQAIALLQNNPEAFQQLPDTLQQSAQLSIQSAQPIEVFVAGTKQVTETKVKVNRPVVEICDISSTIIDPTCRGDINKAKFVIHKFETNLEELRSSGDYKNLEFIDTGNSILGDEDYSSQDNSSFNFQDAPRKKFMAYEYWGFWDINGTGTVEPFVATWVGNVLIRLETNPYPDKKLPFVVVKYLPKRKSLYGEPDGALIRDNQDLIGAITRGMVDIMAANANGQRGHRRDALDPTNKRRFDKGLDYQYNPTVDPRQAFHTHTFSEIPVSAQWMLQLQNHEAESLTGVKAYSDGISGNGLGDLASGVRGALDAASKRELGILRRLAQGIVEIGRKIIAMNAEWLSDEEIVRVTNENFVAIKREELAGQFDLRLSISTAEEDNAKAQELAFMLQTIGPNSDPAEVRMIRAEIARLRKMPDLAKKIESYEPQPDPLEEQRKQLELQLLQAQIADYMGKSQENQAQAILHQAKAKEANSNADLKNLDFVEQESGVKQERDLQKQGEQAKANAKLEVIKASLNKAKESA